MFRRREISELPIKGIAVSRQYVYCALAGLPFGFARCLQMDDDAVAFDSSVITSLAICDLDIETEYLAVMLHTSDHISHNKHSCSAAQRRFRCLGIEASLPEQLTFRFRRAPLRAVGAKIYG